jgi:colanic acid/amylovoran biosynthesis protein
MKPLTLEIHGTGTHNRGAELMTIAIAERMGEAFPGVRLVAPIKFGSFEARAKYRLWTTCDFSGRNQEKLTGFAIKHSSPAIRSALGVLDPSEVDAVLDASGFAFSDQWGTGSAKRLLRKMRKPERRAQPLILLPQALGPFEVPKVAAVARDLFSRAALVCARDARSLAAAETLGGARLLRKYPDFTVAVRPVLPDTVSLPERFSVIVPNCRMMDKTGSGAGTYIPFLCKAIELLRQRGMNPVFVLHDSDEDRSVIAKVAVTHPLPVLEHGDPRVLKGILGKAEMVLGSRFHALVSALSQGVPCLGAGWSHKYPELFRDFEVEDLLLSDLGSFAKLECLVESLACPQRREGYAIRIRNASAKLKGQTEMMWQEIEGMLRLLK